MAERTGEYTRSGLEGRVTGEGPAGERLTAAALRSAPGHSEPQPCSSSPPCTPRNDAEGAAGEGPGEQTAGEGKPSDRKAQADRENAASGGTTGPPAGGASGGESAPRGEQDPEGSGAGGPGGCSGQPDRPGAPRPSAAAGEGDAQRAEEAESLDGPLPEEVRRRVVAMASQAFGSLTSSELPPSLRRYANFTPHRRAKLAANAIAAVLESDSGFRQRMASLLRQAQPGLAEALEAGAAPAAADPKDVAAAAYLLRPPGWTRLIAAAGDEVARARKERVNEEIQRELRKAKEELAQLRASSRAEAEKARAELDAARKEADTLQRKVRSAVNEVRRTEAALRKVEAELESVRAAAAAERAQAEADARRLRARLAEAEAAVEAGRRAAREGRSIEDMRLRLLLDTVLDAAQGLRRELALPPTTVRPADTVEAVAPGRMTPKDIARRALSEDDPALLDQLLALPQTHLVVDGYNVTKTGYPNLPLEKQRLRLLNGLAALAAQTRIEITCVFDGADLQAPVLLTPPRGVRVLFSKAGQTADELIRHLVRAEPPGRPVVVVSADREVADGVRRNGARPVASTLLLKRLARV